MTHPGTTLSWRHALLICLILSSCSRLAAAQTLVSPRTEPPTVVATGEAIVMRAPDLAFVTIGVEADDGRPRNAERKAAEAMANVQSAIGSLGLGADAIRTLSFTLQPRLQFRGGRRYFVRHVIEVRVEDLAKLGDLLDAVGEARASTIGSLRFDLEDRRGVELEALRLAVADATERAHAIAAGSGQSVAAILQIHEQRMSSPSPVVSVAGDAPAIAGRGGGPVIATTIERGDIQIRARVTLTASVRWKGTAALQERPAAPF